MTIPVMTPPYGRPLRVPQMSLEEYEALRASEQNHALPISSNVLIYESRDGLMQCFEDREGHLNVVNAARFF